MGQPYIGEIRLFGGNFAPAGWAFCDGALMPISENDALFTLIGTTYGGDGQETFALPNLASRIPIHAGNGYILGEMAGVEQVTLTVNQIPAHTHPPVVSGGTGNQADPGNGTWAVSNLGQFSNVPANANMAAQAIGPIGGSQPHDNMMPYLCVSFIISLFGIYPQQS